MLMLFLHTRTFIRLYTVYSWKSISYSDTSLDGLSHLIVSAESDFILGQMEFLWTIPKMANKVDFVYSFDGRRGEYKHIMDFPNLDNSSWKVRR